MEYAIVSNKLVDAASWMEMREGDDIVGSPLCRAIAQILNPVLA